MADKELCCAAIGGDLADVERLLRQGADVNATDKFLCTALMHAAVWGHLGIVKLLLEAGADAAMKDEDGRTASDVAKLFNHTAVVEALAAHEASSPASKKQKTTSGGASSSSAAPQATGDKGKQLIDAAKGGDTAGVERLLGEGAGVDSADGVGWTEGWTALHHGCASRHDKVAAEKAAAETTAAEQAEITGGGCHPVGGPGGWQSACKRVLQKLMNHRSAGPFLRPVDPVVLGIPDYFTVIKEPMDLGTVKTRLMGGYYPSAQQFEEAVCLVFSNATTWSLHVGRDLRSVGEMAVYLQEKFNKNFELVRTHVAHTEGQVRSYLPRGGERPTAVTNIYNRNLLTAAARGDAAEVERQLQAGANVNATDEHSDTPLHKASYNGSTQVAPSRPLAPNHPPTRQLARPPGALMGWGRKHTADAPKSTVQIARERAREAMYQGGDVSSDDVTARELEQTKKLAQRIYDGFHEDLDLKLEVGHAPPPPSVVTRKCEAARRARLAQREHPCHSHPVLHEAARRARLAQREHPCRSQPVLHEAAFRGELDKVKRLVRKGADVNSWWDQLTALHYACMRGLDPVASHLIKKGADVNASSNTGFTPLGAAAINGNLSTVKLLLEAGADASSVTSSDSRLAPAIVEALAERRVMGAADEQEVEITEEERRTLEAEWLAGAADVEPRDW
jgi:ankyrin repeat protein